MHVRAFVHFADGGMVSREFKTPDLHSLRERLARDFNVSGIQIAFLQLPLVGKPA